MRGVLVKVRENNTKICGQITWVYTENFEGTCRFYGNLLGLELIRNEGTARIFQTGEKSCIGVCKAFEDRVVNPVGGMITLVTDDVDSWYALLEEKGAQLRGPPKVLENFGVYSFFACDPNGYVIEFQQFLTQKNQEK
jgi:predicted enzyme related to lactoylglutathione lyase